MILHMQPLLRGGGGQYPRLRVQCLGLRVHGAYWEVQSNYNPSRIVLIIQRCPKKEPIEIRKAQEVRV